jgi:WD40 repeat protein
VDKGGALRIWDVAQRTAVGAPITVPGEPWALAVAQNNAPGELWLAVALAQNPATAGSDAGTPVPAGGHVYLVNGNDPARHHLITLDATTEQSSDMGLALSADGNTLAAGGADSVVKLWDISNRLNPTKLKDLAAAMESNGNVQGATSLGFSPDGKFLGAGYGGFFLAPRLRIFELKTFTIRNERVPEIWTPFSVAFSPNGGALVVGAGNCNKLYYCQD